MVATEGAWTLSVGAEREGGPVLVVWRGWGGGGGDVRLLISAWQVVCP